MQPHRLVLLLILLLGGVVRFYGLGAKSLWFDEALSWRLLQFPVGEMIGRTADPRAVHPPLYFLTLRVWRTFWGDSEFALRSLAGVCGVATILGTYSLVRELAQFSRRDNRSSIAVSARTAALLAAALVALSALQIHASKQVRGYSMGSALFVWSSWALVAALVPHGRIAPYWALYTVLALALCYTHHVAVLSVVAQGVFIAAYLGASWCARRRAVGTGPQKHGSTSNQHPTPSLSSRCGDRGADDSGHGIAIGTNQTKYALLAAGALILGFTPWISTLMRQALTLRTSEISRTTLLDIPQSVFTTLLTTWAEPVPVERVALWCLFGVLVMVFVVLAFRGGWGGWFLILTGLVPVLVAFLFSTFSGRGIVRPRYMTFAQVSWLCSIAVVISWTPYRIERSVLACLSLCLAIYSIFNSWPVIGPSAKPGMREAVRHILAQREGNEPVIARSPYVLFGASYYARGVTHPLLCVSEPRQEFKHGSAHLRDDDFISSYALSRLSVTGAWILSTDSYEDSKRLVCPVPFTWKLLERAKYEQDYVWEMSVSVEHYRSRLPSD